MEKKKIEDIKKEIEREFPEDFALQQVHIARKVLAEEAKEKGIRFLEIYKNAVKRDKRGLSRMTLKNKNTK